jgi:hypothetical protein
MLKRCVALINLREIPVFTGIESGTEKSVTNEKLVNPDSYREDEIIFLRYGAVLGKV